VILATQDSSMPMTPQTTSMLRPSSSFRAHPRSNQMQQQSKPGTPLINSFEAVPPNFPGRYSAGPSPSIQALALPHRSSIGTSGAASPVPTGPRPTLQSTSHGISTSLPPLCPALLMPHCETWLGVGFDQLMDTEGTFGVLGVSGTPLLYVSVGNGGPDGGKTVCVSLTPSRIPLLATISSPPVDSRGGAAPAEIRGGSGQPYGELRCSSLGKYSLICAGVPVIYLSFDSTSGKLLLHSAVDSALVAHASRCTESDYFGRGEHLEVRASPGVDGVLVLCCVLSVVLFGSGLQLPAISPTSSHTSLR